MFCSNAEQIHSIHSVDWNDFAWYSVNVRPWLVGARRDDREID